MPAEREIDDGIDDGEIELVALGDGVPEMDGGAAERVGADAEAGGADGFHVDDGGEVVDVRLDEVSRRAGGGCEEGGS